MQLALAFSEDPVYVNVDSEKTTLAIDWRPKSVAFRLVVYAELNLTVFPRRRRAQAA